MQNRHRKAGKGVPTINPARYLPLAQGAMLHRTSVLQVLTMLTVSLASINQADILPWCNSILPHFPMLKLLHTSSGTEETLLWVFINIHKQYTLWTCRDTSCCHLQLGTRWAKACRGEMAHPPSWSLSRDAKFRAWDISLPRTPGYFTWHLTAPEGSCSGHSLQLCHWSL